MDPSETLVEQYLKLQGFSNPEYEPDGNVPPDFLIDGRIAIEVRRLNQNFDDGAGKGLRGLEETAVPLWRRMMHYLTNLAPAPASGQSWYVFYKYSRPIPQWKELKRGLDGVLLPFMAAQNPQPFGSSITPKFHINVYRCPTPKPTFFRVAGNSDEQSGGWLINEIGTNLKHCVAEKTAKISTYRLRYPEWWLVLPDHIGYSLDNFERELFRKQVTVHRGTFDRVILLDPQNPTRSFEV